MSWLSDLLPGILGDVFTGSHPAPPNYPGTPPISGGSGGNPIGDILKNLPGTTGTLPGLPGQGTPFPTPGSLPLPPVVPGTGTGTGILIAPNVTPPDLGGGVATQAINTWIATVNGVTNNITAWGHNFTQAVIRGTKFAAVDVVLLLLLLYGVSVFITGDSNPAAAYNRVKERL